LLLFNAIKVGFASPSSCQVWSQVKRNPSSSSRDLC